jgi:acyl-CoA hydrolase
LQASPPTERDVAGQLAALIRPGDRVAIGDGAGTPRAVWSALADLAARTGDIDLLLGWSFWLPDVDWSAFRSVTTLMGGHMLRPLLAAGTVRYAPVKYGSVPALLASHLRPDVVVVSARPSGRGLVLGTEVSWLESALHEARAVAVELNPMLPDGTRLPQLPMDRTTVVAETGERPIQMPIQEPGPVQHAIGRIVAGLLPPGATVQFAPGGIGAGVLANVSEPVAIDSGVVTDEVVDLDRRGLLRGVPTAAYAMGTQQVYDWIDGRGVLAGVETTHDVTRLSRLDRFFAVNTALQIDPTGQVNVESVGGSVIGGVGGHADYALGAARCVSGASIVALPSTRRGASTMVQRLDAPTTTVRTDVDIVVTEHGYADLRGLDDQARRAALLPLFPAGLAQPT